MCDEPQIGNVDEGIVERGEDTGNTENELAYHILLAALRFNSHNPKHTISGQRTKSDILLGSGGGLLGSHGECWWWNGIWREEETKEPKTKV